MKRAYSLFLVLVTWGFAALQLAQASEDANLKQTRTSGDGVYEVTVESQLKPLKLGKIHAWTATVTADGAPVTGAAIRVSGGMPIHNHGFPTEPAVTKELEPGVYLIEGMKFSMGGPWVMILDIQAGGKKDSVAFDINL